MATGKDKDARINEEISVPRVRLIGADGDQLGVVSLAEARRIAYDSGLDLVEIAATADPPVCRVMDYGKFKFEQSKKAQAAKKHQKQIQVKEVKFRPGTDDNDYQVKVRNLARFLEAGDKAKVTIRFRGREMAHPELGTQLIARIESDLLEFGLVEQQARVEGKQLIMVLAPKKKK